MLAAWTQLWNPLVGTSSTLFSGFGWLIQGVVGQTCTYQTMKHIQNGKMDRKSNFITVNKFKFLKKQTEEKPETVVWTPPMSLYIWPQINLTGKNIILLCITSLAYEHTGMPRSGDSQQPMKDKHFFSCPAWNWKTRKQFLHAGCYQCISWSCESPFLTHTLTYRGLWGLTNLNNTGGSVRCASRKPSLSSCLSLFPRYKSQPLMQKMVQLGSSSFAGQVWTKCQQFPVHPHSDTLTGAGKRPKGRQLTTGDMMQSIVLLSNVWRRQTLSSGKSSTQHTHIHTSVQ